MDPGPAITALAQVIASGEPAPMVQAMDWPTFAPAFLSVRPSPVFDEIPGVRQAMRELAAPTESAGAMRERLALMSAPERSATVVRLVRDTAAAVLGHTTSDAVEPRRAFKELGFDSLNAVEFANRIAAATGLKVKQALVFDHPNPELLAGHLLTQLFDDLDTGSDLDRDLDSAVDEDLVNELTTFSDDEVFEFISEQFGIS